MWSTSSFLQLSQKFTSNARLAYFASKVWFVQNLQDLWCMVYLADCCNLTKNEELLLFYVNNLDNPWFGFYAIPMALSSVTCQGKAKDSIRAVNNHQHSWSWGRVRNSQTYLMLVTVVPRTFNGNLKEPWLLKQCLALALPLVSKLWKDICNNMNIMRKMKFLDGIVGPAHLLLRVLAVYATTTRRGNSSLFHQLRKDKFLKLWIEVGGDYSVLT